VTTAAVPDEAAVPDDAAPVRIERHGAVLVLTLNRPHVRNAIDRATSTLLGQRLHDAGSARDTVRAIVITGAGTSFSAGADLRELANGRSINPGADASWGFAGIARHPVPQPVIAAVNGPAMGGGFEIALACDLIVASRDACFGLPEVTRGRVAGGGGLLRLPRQAPFRVALEMTMTGRIITATEAERWGIVNEVVDPAAVLTRAIALAELIAANAPLAVQASKKIIYDGMDRPLAPAGPWDTSEEIADVVRASYDAAEGARAFVEKRPPRWEGR
jgi:crotonobetainyl-CoA hydratase